jgi:hypothetical protein
MKRHNYAIKMLPLTIFGCLLIFFNTPVFAQDHSGHKAPSTTTVKAKSSNMKISSPEETTQEVPQVEITPEQQKLIGVKAVKVALRPLQKVIRTVGSG